MLKRRVVLFILSSLLILEFGCGRKKSDEAKAGYSQEGTQAEAQVNQSAASASGFKPFPIYTDKNAPDNHFIPSGWMGDYGDIKMNLGHSELAHSGGTCIEIIYAAQGSQGARWAGVYWQNTPNNWGNNPSGYNLMGATKLTFWARGKEGGERVEEFKLGGISGDYPDSDTAGIGPVVLSNEWKEYTIDLSGKDLTHIIGGFCWSTNSDVNPKGATFYLDDIRYE